MSIIFKEGSEPGYIIVYFIVHKIISELKRAILNTP
jgi:hypothetical protein